jgi:predicted GH43/DUF377 family glycosyl hydrolase
MKYRIENNFVVERLNNGEPIIAPRGNSWESGVTFNSAVVRLERSVENDPLILHLLGKACFEKGELAYGVVAMLYRARPARDPGYRWTRSYVGLALFTPDLQPIKRYADPVMVPGVLKTDCDYLGVEDPRVTKLDGYFYAVYCGLSEEPLFKHGNCLARSRDLMNWEKLGFIKGLDNFRYNKDGVLFPDKVNGHYVLLHRPMFEHVPLYDFAIELAVSSKIDGIWKNCGKVMQPYRNPVYADYKIGAGSVPIHIGDSRYLLIYHTGSYLEPGNHASCQYDLHAAIFNMKKFDPDQPHLIVEKRIEPLMVPETKIEVDRPFADSVGNVLFTCGTYEYNGFIYIIYGGGDSFILAARVNKTELFECFEKRDDSNPYLPCREVSPRECGIRPCEKIVGPKSSD